MKKAFLTLFMLFASLTMLFSSPAVASPTAANIFSTMGATTTIDDGGVIHSQTRSIYSFGGGQISVRGKSVSLFAVDPPSFSAGCSGISWHFGGFAFISMDEIRQLVEAISQAALGVAVDLAMQTLCPQCYAVMSKLRDIANAMRNAAADACQIARALVNSAAQALDIPTAASARKATCADYGAKSNTSDGWLSGVAGSACNLLSNAETAIKKIDQSLDSYTNGGNQAGKETPSVEDLAMRGNVTYRALTALGYKDGFIKDAMLSMTGMTLLYASSESATCSGKLPDLAATTPSEQTTGTAAGDEQSDSAGPGPTKPDQISSTPAVASKGGSTKGPLACHLPPIQAGLGDLANTLICGFNPKVEGEHFASKYYKGGILEIANTSLGQLCPTQTAKAASDAKMYTCRGESVQKNGSMVDCLNPRMEKMSTLLSQDGSNVTQNGYTGLVWMIADALYDGAMRISKRQPLSDNTVAILNGSGYPLYRVMNMAAVYPGTAREMLEIYTGMIAIHYALDTITRVYAIGANPTIDLRIKTNVPQSQVSQVQETIMNKMGMLSERKSEALNRLNSKRALVEQIVQTNRALQAEIVSTGLIGNSGFALSLKRQLQGSNAPNPQP